MNASPPDEGFVPPVATFGDAAIAAEPFLGLLVLDKFEQSNDFNGAPIVQYHWGVRVVRPRDAGNLQWAVGEGATGMLHSWVKYNLTAHQPYMLALAEFGRVFGQRNDDGSYRALGVHGLEPMGGRGFVAYWIRETPVDSFLRIEGRKVNPKYTPSREWALPYSVATPEEQKAVLALPTWSGPVEGASGQTGRAVSSTPPAVDLDSMAAETVRLLIGLHDGHTLAHAARNAVQHSGLSVELKQAVALGAVAAKLIDAGLLVEDSQGVYHVAAGDVPL